MTYPLAVAPSVRTPGLYLTVNLLAGVSSPSTGVLRVVVIAPKSSSGDLTEKTEVRLLAGEEAAATAFGIGTVGHLCCKQIFAQYPMAQVYGCAPTAGAGTATLNITTSGVPSTATSVLCDVMGREWEVAWLVGETSDDIKNKIIASVNERSDDLMVTAATAGPSVFTLNSKVPGNVGNDVRVQFKLSVATGTAAIAGALTPTNLAGGATDPSLSASGEVLEALEAMEFHYIVPCLSNTDVANVATANNIKAVYDHIDGLDQGLQAKLQQFIVGYTANEAGGGLAKAIATTASSNSCNNAVFGELIWCEKGRGLPGELAGRECGGRVAAISLDPAANRIDELLDGYIGAVDKINDKPTAAEMESALYNGVTPVTYNAQDAEQVKRPIVNHSKTDTGADDNRLLDTQNVDATFLYARDIRDNLPLAFPNAKLSKDLEAGDDPLPKGVTEERDIKAWVVDRSGQWCDNGVLDRATLREVVADGSLIVQVNDSDATQVDLVLPERVIQPLAKMGVVAQRRPW